MSRKKEVALRQIAGHSGRSALFEDYGYSRK